MRFEFTEEEVATLIDALGVWMEQPSEWEGEEWLRRQDIGADLDLELREGLATGDGNVADDTENHTFTQTEQDFIQAGIDAREQAKATSRAATRREQRLAELAKGTATPLINDPVDW